MDDRGDAHRQHHDVDDAVDLEDGLASEDDESFKWLRDAQQAKATAQQASSSTGAAQRSIAAAAMKGAPDGSTVYGKGSLGADDGDLELQPLTGEQSASTSTTTTTTTTTATGGASETTTTTASGRPKKPLYEVWPSRSKFFCRGMVMTGGETEMGITPNCSVPNLCVWTCILAPCTLYFLWVFPHLWKKGSYAMPLATLAVFLMATGFLLATCCSDPGIIPRREVIWATKTDEKLEAELGYDPLIKATLARDGKGGSQHVPPELSRHGYRWCRTCRIVRPPRASHCPDCDNCVLRYDHHCPFVNNCVGQRNYHFFFGFVTSVLCLAIMVLPVLFWWLNSENFEMAVDGLTHVSSGALKPVFYALIACGSLIGIAVLMSALLWFYHVFLIATNRTTKEYRRNLANITEEPTLCASRGPRLFDPAALVDPREIIRQDEAPPPPTPNLCQQCFGDDDDY